MSSNYQFTNNAATTLASSILIGATSLTVAASTGALFPTLTGTNFFYCTLQNTAGTVIEIVKVTARSTDTFTIVRAQEGTSASAFASGDKVELRLTAGEINQLFSGITQGAGTDQVFQENGLTVNANYTLTTNRNAMSVGPITVASGVSVTVPSGQRWVIL
jgi:hypothetical protein